ncbi:MAG: prolyl oligopeptidase family serine peptidase [Novosphingobium sp.]|nr:prolyl oligopeptidase family serine peptidase [Novosphingobium sp.]
MRLLALALPLLAVCSAAAVAQGVSDDPYIWLEEKDSPRALAWVEARNAVTVKKLEADPRYATLYSEALALASAKDRIPMPRFIGGEIYNFWQDADHLRGIWRKTSLANYRTANPQWQTVLDIDALGKAEGKSWVWKGAQCLQPAETRCLVSLSDGGEDAVEVREFDLATGRFVEGGFRLPRAKSDFAWEDENHLLVATEWSPGDLTESGYPYVVKRLTRGRPLADAVEIYRGEKKDVGVGPALLHDGQGNSLPIIQRSLDFFHSQTFVVTPAGVRQVAMPEKVTIDELVAGRVILKLDEDWSAAGPRFKAGSLAEVDLAALIANPGKLAPRLVWSPGPRSALEGVGSTKGRLLLATLDNVRGRVLALTPKRGGGWTTSTLKLPDNLALDLGSSDLRSEQMFVTASGFTTPTTLYLGEGSSGKLAVAKTLPAKFDAGPLTVRQLEATSSDGTKIPYFVVHRKDIAYDGSTPTLLGAYGGFQVSSTPYYSALTGRLWLERGGAFALANIRGGGEFGPAWHQAGLGTKRQIIYDDFAAVGRDLIARKITSPRRLGIQGGSNGGLLVGVQMIQNPELWNAVAIQIPLLDMIRISKIAAGASWQGEYGDVNADPAVMEFWRKTSPYQNLRKDGKYPEPFIFTTTKDDRTGPQHARKFAARMEEYGLPFYYYENTEGGHGAGADIKQAARSNALTMTYFMRKLMD